MTRRPAGLSDELWNAYQLGRQDQEEGNDPDYGKVDRAYWGGYHQGWHDAAEEREEGKSLAEWFQVR